MVELCYRLLEIFLGEVIDEGWIACYPLEGSIVEGGWLVLETHDNQRIPWPSPIA